MGLEFIKEMYIPIVLVICLCVGYVMKHFLPSDNRWIPLVMAILGGVLACIAQEEITIYVVGAGMVTGLASTGLHQAFSQLIGGDYAEVEEMLLEEYLEGEDIEDDEEEIEE